MCFTVNVNIVKEELESRYGSELLDPEKYNPSYYYHAFAFPELPVLYLNDSDEREMRPMKWGLVPSWTRTVEDASNIRKMTHNARLETVDEKASFADSFKSRRAIVPVSGFFEWQHLPSGKRPWYIYSKEQPVISLAAIFDIWHKPEIQDDKDNYDAVSLLLSFSILTTAANRMMSEIHNSKKRMPLIIPEGLEEDWLRAGNKKAESIRSSISEDFLDAHTVSPSLLNPKSARNIPEIIEPYVYILKNPLSSNEHQ